MESAEEREFRINRRFHDEFAVSGFTKLNGTLRFFGFVRSLCPPGSRVLDFGAGRGAWFHAKQSDYCKSFRDLRTAGAHVVAADVDEVVRENESSDEQVVLRAGAPLPFEDGEFDLVLADFVFEHLDAPETLCSELRRVTKPGGWICARTANRYGYVTLASAIVPNPRHGRALRTVQPARKEVDVFPTAYRLNTPSQVRRHFPGCEVHRYYDSAEPAYYFGRAWLYRLFLVLHKLLPDLLQTGVCFFIRVPEADARSPRP